MIPIGAIVIVYDERSRVRYLDLVIGRRQYGEVLVLQGHGAVPALWCHRIEESYR